MKKILIFLLISTVLLASCTKEALDTQPYDRYTDETFWTSEKNASAALTGCYSVLRNSGIYGGTATPLWEETISPNAYIYDNSFGFNVIANGTQTANNSAVINTRWEHCYSGIGRCNTLIIRIDGIEMAETVRDQMKAEAKFLRAVYYSLLEMYYGGAPIILDIPDPEKGQGALPRNSREEVVQQVLKDLDEAAAVLPAKYPTAGDLGRATKGAALAFKAKVLLFEASALNNPSDDMQKWDAAAKAAKAVMDLTEAGYGLFPNYRELFLPANDNGMESIFAVQFKAPEQGSSFDLIGRQYNTNAPLRGMIDAYDMRDGLPPSESSLYDPINPYKDRDPRMYQTIVYPGDTYMGKVTTPTTPFKITGYGVKKYTIYDKEPNENILNDGRSDINYMVIRYADVLLMYAEAQNEVLTAPDATVHDAVNSIRERAGLVPFELPDGLTKAEMRELIRHERRIELAFEGFYYTDIRRWKTAETVMNAVVYDSQQKAIETRRFNAARDYWWPVPLAERDLNPNLEQNPNY